MCALLSQPRHSTRSAWHRAAAEWQCLACRTSSRFQAGLQTCALTGQSLLCSCCVCRCCVERDDQHQNMCLTLLCRQAVNVQITQHGTAYNYNLYAVQAGSETLASVRVPTGKSCHASPALSMHMHHTATSSSICTTPSACRWHLSLNVLATQHCFCLRVQCRHTPHQECVPGVAKAWRHNDNRCPCQCTTSRHPRNGLKRSWPGMAAHCSHSCGWLRCLALPLLPQALCASRPVACV